jgi:hypothetical protein
MQRLVEIRSYKLKPGTGATFHDLVTLRSIPLLREQTDTEVVAFGPSVHDPDTYFLVRAYDNLEHLRSSQDAFYSSDAWRNGPRQAIIDLIESDWNVVLWLSPQAVAAVRESVRPVASSRQS